MKRFTLLTFLLFAFFGAFAQTITVKSFKPLPMDMTASSLNGKRIDQNGQVAALIKIVTTETGFTFEGGTLGIVDSKQENGEVWVWVPRASRKITIKHQQLGVLRDYRYPVEIESERTYEMVLTTGKVETIVKQEVTQQYLAFQISPANATLEVNDQLWEVGADGSAMKYVNFGTYTYRVQAKDYHTEAGMVTVDDPDNTKIVLVTLRPNYGWIEVAGTGNLQGASVYIDNIYVGKTPYKSEAVKSGQHTVRIAKELYSPYSEKVMVVDNDTTRISPSLAADFANVTLQVDAEAEIWVNNEKKGIHTWTGSLGSGTYKIECKLDNHETTVITKDITPQRTGQTIKLESPRPIYGSLDVVSTPNFATLYIDGKKIGETPRFIKDLLIGSHELRLAKEGCAPIQKTIVIKKGETLEVKETLATGKSVTVKTDRAGDKVYVDNTFVGETPITTSVGFGQHTIKVTRNNVPVEKTITIAEQVSDKELLFEFGRLITIKTDQDGDAVFVDGNKVGVSPISIDLPLGSHTIRAERNKKYDEIEINTQAFGSKSEYMLTLHSETVSHFVENGISFVTLDFAYSPAPQTSFGASFGMVKRFGWFVSAASNFNFNAMKADLTADAEGLINGEYPDYTGENCSTRISVMGGLLVNVAGPLCLCVGAGYGSRVKSWYTNNDHLVKYSGNSYNGLDTTAGLQLNIKGFTISINAVTTNFKTLEMKAGFGYCWKRK